jgi:hypothetical protein
VGSGIQVAQESGFVNNRRNPKFTTSLVPEWIAVSNRLKSTLLSFEEQKDDIEFLSHEFLASCNIFSAICI